jgi:hypothetical protein
MSVMPEAPGRVGVDTWLATQRMFDAAANVLPLYSVSAAGAAKAPRMSRRRALASTV